MLQKKTQRNDGQKKEKNDGAKKEEGTPTTVVLNVDMHCDGCASKIIRYVKGYQGQPQF